MAKTDDNTFDNNFIDEDVVRYLHELGGDSPEPASTMEREARERDFPIVGPLVGRFLKLVTVAIRPKLIVELGSGFGYSAFWFGQGSTRANIHLTEYREENLRKARDYLSQTEHPDRYHYRTGDALNIIDEIDGEIDLIFLDLDKEEYPEALKIARDRLDEGGWLLADNVLWRGDVANENPDDESTRAIRSFNRQLQTSGWESTLLPLRDGITLAHRTSQPE